MASTLLRIAFVLLLLFVALSVLGFLVGLVTTIVDTVVTLLVLGALLYGCYWLFWGRSGSSI
ncbi:hypothetical protein AUR64_00150 [Haloprofundus marisrubri]|uniref:Uncharacterized protein n=1 Tax=Haloprofundus marisrubri TaxID=1514971 RepID=A0A0W1RDZ9_9EURY|nr:hypothetical protein [Haloprofundus marisrubri]KTG11640.1 hypothetical protein AUR64_00150 [Haloprofundus marisrubri]